MLEPGITNSVKLTVTEQLTAMAAGSGSLRVFGTPFMIALIEQTAFKSVQPFLDEGQGTVGTLVNVEHLAPTPVGMEVECRTKLEEVDGRRLVFSAEVFDKCGLVGKGTHQRFIVGEEKFQTKADAKAAQ